MVDILRVFVSITGLYAIFYSYDAYKKQKIKINGEWVQGERAKKFSVLGIFIGVFFLFGILLSVLFEK